MRGWNLVASITLDEKPRNKMIKIGFQCGSGITSRTGSLMYIHGMGPPRYRFCLINSHLRLCIDVV